MTWRTWRTWLVLACCLWPVIGSAAGTRMNTDLTVEGSFNSCDATGGATNAYACNLNPALEGTQYQPRACFAFRADAANTSAATVNFNSVGPKTLKKRIAGALVDVVAGDIGANQVVQVCYDGTVMQLISGDASVAPVVLTLSAATGTPNAIDVGTRGARIIAERFDISGALTFLAPSGTPTNGQSLILRLKPASAPQNLAFTGGAGGFCAVAGQTMPSTTGPSTVYVEYGFLYNAGVSPSPCWVFDGGTKATAPLDLAGGGTGVALVDPNAHRLMGWDDVDNATSYFTIGSGLTYTQATHTLAATGVAATGTIQIWPGMLTLPDGTAGNLLVPSQVFQSTGTQPTDAPKLQWTDLVFDNASTDQHAFSCFVMPNDYNAAQPTTMYLNWRRTTGTTAQNADWKAAVAATAPGGVANLATKIFNAVTTSGASAAGTTTNALRQSTITLNMDSAAGRNTVCVMFGRNADSANDTLADPAAVTNVWLEYTKQ
jgi:hypothetical protein